MRIPFSAEKFRFSSLVINSPFTIYAPWTYYCRWEKFEFSCNIKHTVTVQRGPVFPFKSKTKSRTSLCKSECSPIKIFNTTKIFMLNSHPKVRIFPSTQNLIFKKGINTLRPWVEVPINANINTVLMYISAFINTRESEMLMLENILGLVAVFHFILKLMLNFRNSS